MYLSGHWADLGGGVPIAIKTASNAALLVLQKENYKAFSVLAKYMDGKISLQETKESKSYKTYDNSWVQKPTPAQRQQLKEDKVNT